MAYPTENCGAIIRRLRYLSGALLGAVALLLLLGRSSSAQGSDDEDRRANGSGGGRRESAPGYSDHGFDYTPCPPSHEEDLEAPYMLPKGALSGRKGDLGDSWGPPLGPRPE